MAVTYPANRREVRIQRLTTTTKGARRLVRSGLAPLALLSFRTLTVLPLPRRSPEADAPPQSRIGQRYEIADLPFADVVGGTGFEHAPMSSSDGPPIHEDRHYAFEQHLRAREHVMLPYA